MPKSKKAKPAKPTGLAIHSHATSVLLEYIDDYLGEHNTEGSQINALAQVIEDHELRHVQMNCGDIYKYKMYMLGDP